MFPRTALVIVGLFVVLFIALFVRGAFVAQQAHSMVSCNRGIAYPEPEEQTKQKAGS
jgi:hypothetical protein